MKQECPIKSDNTRMRLLHAAIQIFAKKNFDGASIREIAAKAEINSSQIFFYFNDKDGLYLESLRLSSRIVALMIGEVPEIPINEDTDALLVAKVAIWSHVKIFVKLGLFENNINGIGKLQELEFSALKFFLHEIRSTRAGSENIITEALLPHIQNMTKCIKILRNDLSDDSIFKMGISIHGQLLFFACHQQLFAMLRGKKFKEESIGELVDHFSNFILNGIIGRQNETSATCRQQI